MNDTDTRTVWQLARLADCGDPDTSTSAGAEWLRHVERCADELGAYDDRTDAIHELADGAVPIYTHERWTVFVDVCAYNEDISELGAEPADMEQAAGIALYMIAERLLVALAEMADDDDDDDTDDD